ncbi:MAG: hypothetical protein HYT49_00105 [Candidatus Wildermuthbacteria bacterium]|nr:hypothetical protein [Candidatus Wildermuthbacteria bacterium]
MIPEHSKFSKGRRKRFENVVVGAVFGGMLFIVLGFLVYQNVSMAQKRSSLEGRLQELRVEENEYLAQIQAKEAAIANIQLEERQEKILREQGLYKKEGEEVVTILPPEENTVEGTTEGEGKTERVWWNPFSWF